MVKAEFEPVIFILLTETALEESVLKEKIPVCIQIPPIWQFVASFLEVKAQASLGKSEIEAIEFVQDMKQLVAELSNGVNLLLCYFSKFILLSFIMLFVRQLKF
ncbi:hypothetical protein PPERSA_11705 [Pseudocohnilembus persalinus]|uniref:Uncharacterized protein n=1 Tax=Pseudocohnilembus persalinus TaxID=266149 RepID=A0A0V0R6T2_PSEPJ|nr:hypothetical protein PPERSA_11705 [Pseudocohnilembus persalinus]|eukprot:KRX10207.1 hypothetical protein PPERSA_11705 [Pseudocohnilembus persalinus]